MFGRSPVRARVNCYQLSKNRYSANNRLKLVKFTQTILYKVNFQLEVLNILQVVYSDCRNSNNVWS